MAFKDLRDFIALLEKRNQLKRIVAPVSSDLEITEITDRICKSKNNNVALLFENVEGHSMPVLMNAFGSFDRVAWALGVDKIEDLADRMRGLISTDLPTSIVEKLQKLFQVIDLGRYTPKIVAKAPCQEVVNTDNPSLDALPILKCWPEDGGRFITLPMVISRDPASGKRNMGMYRMQVFDSRTTGMHWHLHKGGAAHHRESERQNRRLEVAVALGGDPATIFSASAPLPHGIDELVFAGWLRRDRVDLVKAKTVDLEVPAEAEIVLEGYVDPAERREEGPFGDHTGYYSLVDRYPVFHLTGITHRKNPIYPATIVGKPPMEDCYFGKVVERFFLPLLQMLLPEVVDMSMPLEGVFHNIVIFSIKKSYPGQAKKVMYAIWGLMLMMLTKTIIIVDEGTNVQDLGEVIWRVGNNVDPRRDVVIIDGPLDALDHSSPTPHYGSKMGIDATKKTAIDGHPRPWPNDIVMDPEIKRRVDAKWKSLGLP
ncbi:MAG: menaquinone biosynthesis decarboxylase [Dehalococcoidia bacterium]|nr:menaquinone biosynthesis decarboxylase [Dehalococcoidia bacterium]